MKPPFSLPFFALPARALWRVTGEDRVRYLNGQTTRDLTLLQPGQSVYGAVLTGKGKIVGDLFLSATDDALYLDADLSLRETLRERLEKFLIADDVTIDDVTGQFALSRLQGDGLSGFASKPKEGETLAPVAFVSQRFGVEGVDHWIPLSRSFPVPFPALPEAEAADLVDRLEIEHGIARWGIEIDAETLPQEVAFDLAGRGLVYDKGCYVGQETVARIRSIGHVNRRLVRLEQTGGPVDRSPAPLFAAPGEEAGRLTRLAPFPDGKVRALGFLKRKFLETPPELKTEADGRTFRVVS
ncbi:aminomethyltransferase/hypothetical protein [Verrucomicrobium sp. GAS474]|uniref:CAF17-like 4Fe-4S cluster assembly/insertion protein YgfZ n=1 Tax=Verrucomicrobium sp. GAS474 TaxID=1882831 RepID=UPI00087C796D|nr:folate-binding protein YgfZ [Verrucomicrobium sp. GAS474]SDT91882.1 aminomethyltransferase/hypothetical protein [Verrucomicrobium sp. GAS474]